jgi:hypothetical protein
MARNVTRQDIRGKKQAAKMLISEKMLISASTTQTVRSIELTSK